MRITIRRTIRAALAATAPLRYTALSGEIAALVAAGRLVRTGDVLDRLGAGDLKDGYKSHYGRHVAKAYRAATGGEPLRVWAQHRTTGRWCHVFVYRPAEPALFAGLASYGRTRHITATALELAA